MSLKTTTSEIELHVNGEIISGEGFEDVFSKNIKNIFCKYDFVSPFEKISNEFNGQTQSDAGPSYAYPHQNRSLLFFTCTHLYLFLNESIFI